MAEKFVSKRNIRFMLYEIFNVEELCQYEYFSDHSRETFDMVIDTIYKVGTDMMYPLLQEMDANPPVYRNGQAHVHPAVKQYIKQCGEGGWIGPGFAYEVGGQQIPALLVNTVTYMNATANYPLSVYPGLTSGAANLILSFGSQEQKDLYVKKMISGEWQGTMALTEPDAGSSLADIRTQAEETGQGYYKIKGKKIFISAGDTNAVSNTIHLMLARIKGAPAGVKGISMFIVPKYRYTTDGRLEFNDLNCDGIEHKMGYKASPVAQLSMGDENDCHGYLVGEPNQGLSYMFQMMNEARINVGTGAAGKMTAAYYAALEYAQQRCQGRSAADKRVDSPQIPIIEHADVKRMLLFQRAIAEGSYALCLQASHYVDLIQAGVDPERNELLLGLLTPVVKSYPAEMGILATSAAIQCLGGYGYCRDFPVEQYFRDIRIDTLHEGTTGIQGQDLLGRKITMHNGMAYQFIIEEIQKSIDEALKFLALEPYANDLAQALQQHINTTQFLLGIAKSGDNAGFLADATLYLEMSGHLIIAWQWLKQAIVASKRLGNSTLDSDLSFYEGKIATFQYFYKYELPKLYYLASVLRNNTGLTVKTTAKLFAD